MMNKEAHSIVRYCKPTQIQDKVVLISAFYLRKKDPTKKRYKDEIDLSVDLFEHYTSDHYSKIKNALIQRNVTLKDAGCLAKMPFAPIAQEINDCLFLEIDIINDHDSHCLIKNMYQRDEETAYYFLKNVIETVMISEI